MVRAVHDAVRGRTRYKVAGLYRCQSFKAYLEIKLAQHHSVRYVSANVLTGNVLVLFDPESNPKEIASVIERTVLDYRSVAPSRGLSCPSQPRAGSAGFTHTAMAKAWNALVGSVGQDTRAWHRMDIDAVLSLLNSSAEQGLSTDAVELSLKKFGPNIFPVSVPRSKLAIFLSQFNSLPVALLGVAAGLSVFTGGIWDAAVILAVVMINAVIGFATENEAEKTINSLKQLVRPTAQILRSGALTEISAEEVLVGDILVLRPGTYVAADARLLECSNMSADESVLTGESMPARKIAATLEGPEIALADRINMVYAGTLITGGQGLAVVVATGRFSEIGKVQTLVTETQAPETPVERQLETIGNQLVVISGAVCGVVFLIGLLRGSGVIQMLKTAISLAVAAVPEGLPTVATTTLALGINNMRKHNVLIRELEAVCTLGSVQTICFDKTGTITHNRMSVLQLYSGARRIEINGRGCPVSKPEHLPDPGEEVSMLLLVSVLCNETEINGTNGEYVLNGSATENALIHLALSSGMDVSALRSEYPLLRTTYRSETRQFMNTLHLWGDKHLYAFKGSPHEVLSMCGEQLRHGAQVPLTEDDREMIEAENERMAGDALRVLGVAYSIRDGEGEIGNGNGLTWLGLVGMADPIRDRVKESVAAFHRAGLETVMITGDQSPTAYAVGQELNLSNNKPLEILDSSHLNQADPSVMKALSKQVHVFARVSPSHKLQIVQALQSAGKVVAMTGDGINDGPALKAADIGIAMGRTGTDVAREVADVVLEKDDLETLIVAVRDGRTIYENIRKSLHYLLATNFSEILVMFVASSFGLGYPLNAMQLLWINLLSDIFPGLALAMEEPDPEVLDKPPRDPNEPIVRPEDFGRITFEAGAMTAASLAAYGYGLTRYGMGPQAGTIAFQSLTIGQILHAFSCRSENPVLFGSRKMPPNNYLNLAVFGSLALQAMAMLVPGLRSLLGITSITAMDAAVIGGAAVVPLVVNELSKQPPQRGDK